MYIYIKHYIHIYIYIRQCVHIIHLLSHYTYKHVAARRHKSPVEPPSPEASVMNRCLLLYITNRVKKSLRVGGQKNLKHVNLDITPKTSRWYIVSKIKKKWKIILTSTVNLIFFIFWKLPEIKLFFFIILNNRILNLSSILKTFYVTRPVRTGASPSSLEKMNYSALSCSSSSSSSTLAIWRRQRNADQPAASPPPTQSFWWNLISCQISSQTNVMKCQLLWGCSSPRHLNYLVSNVQEGKI